MTNHDSEQPPRTYPAQRIVGALVLLALAVIIIPMVLDFRKGYDVTIDKTNIPPKPDDFRVEVLPLQEGSPPSAPVVASSPSQEVAEAPATDEPQAPAPAPAVTDTSGSGNKAGQAAPAAAPSVHPSATAGVEQDKPVVQTARGTKPPPPPVTVPKPRPKPVQPPPPPKVTPPPSTLPPPSAWVLQVGHFGSRKNADALQQRLRRNGFRAFVDEKVKGGTRTYRVFVGPELVKRNTDILKRELKEDLNLNGIVIPYER